MDKIETDGWSADGIFYHYSKGYDAYNRCVGDKKDLIKEHPIETKRPKLRMKRTRLAYRDIDDRRSKPI